MIPLQKLSKLPRSQKLRKAARLFEEAEQQFVADGRLAPGTTGYLCELMDLLSHDTAFSLAVISALEKARICFVSPCKESEIRRALVSVQYLLLAETGRYRSDWDFVQGGGVLDPSKRHPFAGMQVYLEDIRSPFNVGAMFRAAESFGAEKIWLSPLCADPHHKRAERTAMGCVGIMPWERFPHDPFGGTETIAPSFCGGPFFTLETGGVPLADFVFPSRGILIAGSEELGVSPPALAAANASLGTVTIPTRGAKGSLNVSVAFGIVMQAWAETLAKQ